MDFDQIIKRLDWLDDERRKDKLKISTLEERLISFEGSLPAINQQIKDLSSEVMRLSAMIGRFEQVESSIAQLRVEFTRSLESIEKIRTEHNREVDKVRLADLESINKAVAEVRKGLDPIPDLKKGLQARVEEDFRLGRLIEEATHKFEDTRRNDEDFRRAQRLLEEAQRQDTKRITDVTAETSALRKRVDEQRGKVDVTSESLRKVELRVNDLQSSENERRQSQNSFTEKTNLFLIERDRVWKEWQVTFDEISGKAVNLDAQLQALDATHRAVKRSQEAFDEITQKFERRVNEITEMQRLVEERFRQEWITFKSDDQKRWANNTLAQDEHQREYNRIVEKLNDRIVILEDLTQEVRDEVTQVIDETQKRLQDFLSMSRTWLEQHDRTLGRQK